MSDIGKAILKELARIERETLRIAEALEKLPKRAGASNNGKKGAGK